MEKTVSPSTFTGIQSLPAGPLLEAFKGKDEKEPHDYKEKLSEKKRV